MQTRFPPGSLSVQSISMQTTFPLGRSSIQIAILGTISIQTILPSHRLRIQITWPQGTINLQPTWLPEVKSKQDSNVQRNPNILF